MKHRNENIQAALVVGLLFVGVGNITIPNSIPFISAVYLPVALLVTSIILLLNFNRIIQNPRFPLAVSLAFMSFVPGFLISPLNSYGETKVLSVLIAILLVVSPATFVNVGGNVEFIIKALLATSGIMAVLLLIFGETSMTGRTTLPGLNPIGLGRIVGLAAVILFSLAMIGSDKSLKRKAAILVFSTLSVVAAMSTGSRGPIVSIAVSLITVLVFSRNVAGPRRYFWAVALFSGVISLASLSSPVSENSRILSSDSSGRDELFGISVAAIQNNPVGIGWGNFYMLTSVSPEVSGYRHYPHNIFLEIGVEGGWFALVGFVCLLAAAVWNVVRGAWQGNSSAVMVLGVLIFTVVNASLSSDFVGNRLMWLCIGLSLLTYPPSVAHSGRTVSIREELGNTQVDRLRS